MSVRSRQTADRARERPRASRAPAARAAPAAAARTVPPLLRDPWALAVALAVLPLLFASRMSPMGEPFADDFLFIDFSVLHRNPSWLSGGGCMYYWRPLARQAWYGLLGPTMLAHPGVVAGAQAAMLVAAAVLVYRALRAVWPAPAAAVAAAFPLGMEAARVLVIWPSGAQDLGALLGLSLALHAASRDRAWLVALAGVAAALCKEVAGPIVLLVMLAPFPRARTNRVRSFVTVGGVLALWGAARVAVQPGLAAPVLPVVASGAGLSQAARAAGAILLELREAFGLTTGLPALPVFAVLAAAAVLVPLARRLAGGRLRGDPAWAWCAWGLAWVALGIAPLTWFLPEWAPFRGVIPAAGLGIALVAPLASGPAWWLAPLVAVRLAALLVAPQPPARIPLNAKLAGNPMAYPGLALQQRVVGQARRALLASAPHLAPGARVVREYFPRMVGVAFAGDLSLHAWYGDTTGRWIRMGDLIGPRPERVDAMLEYEPNRARQFVCIEPASVQAACEVFPLFDAMRFDEALRAVARAETLQADTSAVQYLATLESWRAMALVQLGRLDDGDAAAARSQALWYGNEDARYVRASIAALRGQWARVRELLRVQLALYPHDARARELFDEAVRHAGPGSH